MSLELPSGVSPPPQKNDAPPFMGVRAFSHSTIIITAMADS